MSAADCSATVMAFRPEVVREGIDRALPGLLDEARRAREALDKARAPVRRRFLWWEYEDHPHPLFLTPMVHDCMYARLRLERVRSVLGALDRAEVVHLTPDDADLCGLTGGDL